MDITLRYTRSGAGAPLILLHGNGESSEYFAGQTGEFSRHFEVYALDTRGHGLSPRGGAPFTLDVFADDLCAFMRGHGIARARILGFSDGGNIALLFALRHPDMAEKLVLCGANLFPSGMRASVRLPVELGYVLCRDPAKKELLGLMARQPHIDPGSLAALRMPVLVIAGTRDMIKRSHTELIARSIPGARLALVDGDHFIAAKRPAEFNRAALDFLL